MGNTPVALLRRLQEWFGSRPQVGVYLVGGFLRDVLLGRPSHDLDLAIQGDAVGLARCLAADLGATFVLLDEANGVARLVWHGDGARWEIDLARLQGESVIADLGRRDFTVDAMAVPLSAAQGEPSQWPVLDPFGGRGDLQRRRLRLVAPSAFQDDPVRLWRAVRLSAQLGFTLDEQTVDAAQAHAALVVTVAPERVRDEFLKVMALPGSTDHLLLADRLGVLCQTIPELGEGKGVAQPPEHAYDVFHHNLATPGQLERVLSPSARAHDPVVSVVPWQEGLDGYFAEEVGDGHTRATLLKVACLLHDIAKPACKSVEPTGRIRFLGHQTLGAEMAEGILRRLRCSGKGIALVRTAVQHHLRPSHLAPKGQMPSPRAVYRYFRDTGTEGIGILYLAMADFLAARGPNLVWDDWNAYCATIGYALQEGTRQPLQTLPKLVDGYDIMAVFGLSPGPHLRPLLEAVREAQATGTVRTRQEALALVARLLETGVPSTRRDDSPAREEDT
ncbi:MAG: HD domain-containing protein [Dehalococcoidia bacterium]|nr:HD domain-containing protein [Dehalococcoidia bacterium]MDW8119192.1 HD domain-containing protein [Chloroflexota bacterium]